MIGIGIGMLNTWYSMIVCRFNNLIMNSIGSLKINDAPHGNWGEIRTL